MSSDTPRTDAFLDKRMKLAGTSREKAYNWSVEDWWLDFARDLERENAEVERLKRDVARIVDENVKGSIDPEVSDYVDEGAIWEDLEAIGITPAHAPQPVGEWVTEEDIDGMMLESRTDDGRMIDCRNLAKNIVAHITNKYGHPPAPKPTTEE